MIHQVWRARQLRPAWSASLASVVAWTVCLHRDLTIDWDHDAGEFWIMLLRDRTPLGHLGADLPLLMCTRTLVRESRLFPLVVIGLPDLNSARHAVRSGSPGELLRPHAQHRVPRPGGLQRREPAVLHNLTAPPWTCAGWLIPTGCG